MKQDELSGEESHSERNLASSLKFGKILANLLVHGVLGIPGHLIAVSETDLPSSLDFWYAANDEEHEYDKDYWSKIAPKGFLTKNLVNEM